MKRKWAVVLAGIAVFVLFSGLEASAQTRGRCGRRGARFNINQRQEWQQDRIGRGIANGSLTAREAARLEREEARFARVEARQRADGGGLSWRERERLLRYENRMSHDIWRQEHDRQHQ